MNKLAILMGLSLMLPMSANALTVTKLTTYAEECGGEESCAEIAAFDESSSRAFVTNAAENELRILSLDNNNTLQEFQVIDLSVYGGGPNSVAVSNGIVAVAVQADTKTDNGSVVLFEYDNNLGTYTEFHVITAGALPDMLTFTPDGNFLLVANEGEPNDEYTIDPEGSVTIIDTATWTATNANFHAFEDAKLKNVRIYGPGATVSQDLEPEYITVSADSQTAWISLQENNALAKLDVASATVTDIYGLGYKVHHQKKNGFDASDKDDAINIQSWPTFGMYLPDAIASYQRDDATFIITANEGDTRDYDGYSEEARIKDLTLDPKAFPNAEELQKNENLGRLLTTTSQGDVDGDGDVDQLFSVGGRSFSIWNANGKQVYDSGSEFERAQAKSLESKANPLLYFNSDEPGVEEENRSDAKGPEPESVVVGELSGDTYAFIGTERTSDIFIYKISNPSKPQAVGFLDLDMVAPLNGEPSDVGPEGLLYIERDANTGWLFVTNEISNTISLYEIAQ